MCQGHPEQGRLKVSCPMIPNDFTQPVKDQNQAILFIMDQLKLKAEHYPAILESIAESIVNYLK